MIPIIITVLKSVKKDVVIIFVQVSLKFPTALPDFQIKFVPAPVLKVIVSSLIPPGSPVDK